MQKLASYDVEKAAKLTTSFDLSIRLRVVYNVKYQRLTAVVVPIGDSH